MKTVSCQPSHRPSNVSPFAPKRTFDRIVTRFTAAVACVGLFALTSAFGVDASGIDASGIDASEIDASKVVVAVSISSQPSSAPIQPATKNEDKVGANQGFVGDTYSIEAMLGRQVDGAFQCFDPHHAGLDDNTVTYDSIQESLDSYTNGTTVQVTEFAFFGMLAEVLGTDGDAFTMFVNGSDDLFPEGFEDPETGDPLTSACIEIGRDDTMDNDYDDAVELTLATLLLQSDNTTIFGPIDITGAFPSPFDGTLSLVLDPFVGNDVDRIVVDMTFRDTTSDLFADGFESGDATSWTNEVP